MKPGTQFTITRPHTNSTLEYISEETRIKLIDWLLNHPLSYAAIVKKLKAECKVETSTTALGVFYRKWVWPLIVERREYLVEISTAYKKEIKRKPGSFQTATLDALAQRGMRIAMNEETTAKEVKLIIDTIIRLREQIIKEQKLAIYLKQLKLAEKRVIAAEELARNSKLTKEELVDKFRRIFNGEQNRTTNGKNVEGSGEEKAPAEAPRLLNGFTH